MHSSYVSEGGAGWSFKGHRVAYRFELGKFLNHRSTGDRQLPCPSDDPISSVFRRLSPWGRDLLLGVLRLGLSTFGDSEEPMAIGNEECFIGGNWSGEHWAIHIKLALGLHRHVWLDRCTIGAPHLRHVPDLLQQPHRPIRCKLPVSR